jgi:hypothetical protein
MSALFGGGSKNTSTTTSTTAPPPQYTAAYSNLTNAAFNAAQQPLTQYTGPLVAGFTPQQQQGYQTIENLQGSYVPYLNAGAQEISQSTKPIWSGLPSFDTSQLPSGALDRINQAGDLATAAGTQPIAEKTDPYASFAGTTAQNLPGQVAPYTGIAGSLAQNLPGQISPYTGIAGNIAQNLPSQISPYTSQVSGIAGGLQGQAGTAANLANTAAASAPSSIPSFESPYTKNVTEATRALFNEQNAEQLAQQRGSTIGAGAYGGDRQAVSEALLGKQQQLAEAPVLANIQQQGYQQAVAAAQQQAALEAQTGISGGQLQTQAGLGAGQLGLGAGQLQTQAGLGAGQLGLGAAGATTQAAGTAGQLGLGAAGATTQAGLGAGQLGLGAGQLTGQSLAQQGQLGLGAGQLGLGAGQQLFNEFNQQQAAQQQADTTNRWLAQGAGYGLASLGSQMQNLGLAGAAANIGAGQQQQQLAQQQLNIPYEQFLQRQNYPYQQLNFLAPIVEGTGSQAGGTSTTSVPGPSTLSQVAGLGAAGAGILGATGAFGDSGYLTGSGGLFDTGGTYSSATDVIPTSFGGKDGGRVGLAAGGVGVGGLYPGGALPLDTGVPDVSVGMVPALTGHAASPLVSAISAPQTTTQTTGSGGGGSSALGDLGAAAGIAATAAKIIPFFLKDGGLADGGSSDPSANTIGTSALETQQPLPNPLQQMGYERYASMPEEKLRELVLQIPQASAQGQLIRRALMQKQMGNQPVAQAPQNLPSSYLPLSRSGTGGIDGYARGGSERADTVSEEDMDPQPIVDHSGPTVVIRYPSEGHSIDLGIPSSPEPSDTPRGHFAIGGPPAPPLKIDPISHVSTTFKLGTPVADEPAPGVNPPGYFQFSNSPTGVAIPTVNPVGMFSSPGFWGNPTMDTGGGFGNWFAPMAQISPPGNEALGGGATNPTPSLFKFFADGGRAGLGSQSDGSGLGAAVAVPHISLDYMMPPGPVVRGPGPPKPPPASAGPAPSGLDPAKVLTTVKGVIGLTKGLAGKSDDDSEGLAAGGRARLAAGGLDGGGSDDDAPIARAPLPPALAPSVLIRDDKSDTDDQPAKSSPKPKPNDISEVKEAPTPETIMPPALALPPKPSPEAKPTPEPTPSASAAQAPGASEPAASQPVASTTPSIPSTDKPSSAAGRQQVVDFWTGKGVRDVVAQGIADRVHAESGFDPTVSNKDSGALGYYQHLGDRLDRLMAQPNPKSGVTQNNLAYWEVTGGDPIASAHWDEIKAAPTREAAAQLWDKYFERSGASMARRGGPDQMVGAAPAGGGSYTGGAASGGINQAIDNMLSDITARDREGSSVYTSPWMPVLAAGLGMMAGRSPFAAQNIGAGGLEGLRMLAQQQKEIPANLLEAARARQAEIQTGLLPLRMRAAADAAGAGTLSPGTAAGPLAGAGVAAAGTTGAAPSSAAGTAAPVPTPAVQAGPAGMAYPPNFGASGFEKYDALYQSLQNQIVQAQHSLPLDPDHLEQHQARIAQLTESYIKTLAADPRQQAITAGMKTAAEEGQRRINLHGPGAAVFDAQGNLLAQSPQAVDRVDEDTGKIHRVWVNPAIAGTSTQQPPVTGVGRSPAPLVTQTGATAPQAGVTPIQAGSPPPGPGPAQPGQDMLIGLGPGQRISLEQRGHLEQAARETTLKDAQSAQYQQATLNRLQDDADYFYTGAGAELKGKYESYMRLIDPTYNLPVEHREDFIKNAGALTRQATHDLSPRAAFQEVQFINSTLPNITLSRNGLRDVISEYQGLNDYRIAKAKIQDDWEREHGGLGHVEGFETWWNSAAPVTPYTFIIQRMTPENQNELIRKWQGSETGQVELQRLRSQLQFATQRGLFQ